MMEYIDGEICGEVKNVTGEIDAKFVKAVKDLMRKHEINYVHFYWAKFSPILNRGDSTTQEGDMNEQQMQELNKKLTEFAGFTKKDQRFVDYDISWIENTWHYPSGIPCERDILSDFSPSLDACFKWLVPKAVKLFEYPKFSSDEEAMFKFFGLWLREFWIAKPEPISLALALCLAIEKLIDGGNE